MYTRKYHRRQNLTEPRIQCAQKEPPLEHKIGYSWSGIADRPIVRQEQNAGRIYGLQTTEIYKSKNQTAGMEVIKETR